VANDVTRAEFEARVGVLERKVEGEKIVTRHILEQTRRNGGDLAEVKTRLDRIEPKLDGVDMKGLVGTFDGLERKVDGLVRELPRIVGDTMSGAERDARKAE
jgi:hypothetical protein